MEAVAWNYFVNHFSDVESEERPSVWTTRIYGPQLQLISLKMHSDKHTLIFWTPDDMAAVEKMFGLGVLYGIRKRNPRSPSLRKRQRFNATTQNLEDGAYINHIDCTTNGVTRDKKQWRGLSF